MTEAASGRFVNPKFNRHILSRREKYFSNRIKELKKEIKREALVSSIFPIIPDLHVFNSPLIKKIFKSK